MPDYLKYKMLLLTSFSSGLNNYSNSWDLKVTQCHKFLNANFFNFYFYYNGV